MSAARQAVIVALAPDLPLAEQIRRLATAAGARTQTVMTADALWRGYDAWPVLVIIDLAAAGWEAPVRWAKNQPHTRAIPVAAFSRGSDPDAARLAHTAGCDHVWPSTDLPLVLPGLLDQALHPPTRWLEGWDAPAPPALRRGIEQFNAGEYWECHETLEELWIIERRPIRDLYQGILQVGVALYHLQRRNQAGALKMLRRGLPRLWGLPEVCQGVQVARLAAAARAVHDAVVASRPGQIGEFDPAALPRITIAMVIDG